MFRKTAAIMIILLFMFQGIAFAAEESSPKVVVQDSLYGALIGGLLGSAVFLIAHNHGDNKNDHFVSDVSVGVGLGIIGGFAYGLADVTGAIRVSSSGDVEYSMPRLVVVPEASGSVAVKTSIFSASF